MKTHLDDWMASGGYLPAPLKDFHDSKNLFKAAHRIIDTSKHGYASGVSWMVGQCYVIDIFLWFMARRGWTLQRSRLNLDFRDLAADIEAVKAADTEAFKSFLDKRL